MFQRQPSPFSVSHPASRWLVWLIEGCAQVPSWRGTTLRFFDPRPLRWCVRCGWSNDYLAQEVGSRYCQPCARVIVRHHLQAEHIG